MRAWMSSSGICSSSSSSSSNTMTPCSQPGSSLNSMPCAPRVLLGQVCTSNTLSAVDVCPTLRSTADALLLQQLVNSLS
jgi:hypothetical protein